MNSPQDPDSIARDIIDSISYMAIGTADELGQPWVSPVYFASEKYKEFYWISSPESRHSQNIKVRPQVSLVIFDSRIPVGQGQAVYISAIAEEVREADLGHSLEIYNGRFQNPAEHGVYRVVQENVQAPALYRLYRASALEHWILDRDSHPDRRIPVTLSNMGEL